MKFTNAKIAVAGALTAVLLSTVALAGTGDDRPRQINIGLQKIHAAYDHLAHAGDDWGGHRAAAMKDLEAARHELELAQQTYGAEAGR